MLCLDSDKKHHVTAGLTAGLDFTEEIDKG